MATGTFVTAKLMRSNNQTPWGFRLQGGAEFQMPLSMVKVSEGSLAEQAGVQVGDIILKINGVECDKMRHKEAQDAIIDAGNYLELYLERGPMNTWKPSVTILDGKSQSLEPQQTRTFTKTSLEKTTTEEYSGGGIGSGHNSTAKPFGAPKLVHKQFNSPINLYSEKSLEETLNAHTQVLASGATGINFMRPDAPINKESAVFQMVQEEEKRKAKGISGSPEKNGHYDPSSTSSDGPIKHVTAPSGGPSPQKPDERNRNICAHCERLIVGVFCRINNKSLHAECFVCSTCGTSLKNVGYFNINDKLYCDIHARQIRQVLGDGAAAAAAGIPGGYGPGPINSGPPGGYFNATAAAAAGVGLGGGPPGGLVNNSMPSSMNSFKSTNVSSTTLSHNGFQSFNQAPKKFSPVAPPTAPKPFYSAGGINQSGPASMPQTNRHSMYETNNPPTGSTTYNYTQKQETVNYGVPPPSSMAASAVNANLPPSAPSANFISSTITRRTAQQQQQNMAPTPATGGGLPLSSLNRPKSCYSSLPSAYTVTKTFESKTTTQSNYPGSNLITNNYPQTATYASSQTTYSMPPQQPSQSQPALSGSMMNAVPPSSGSLPSAYGLSSAPSAAVGNVPGAAIAPAAPFAAPGHPGSGLPGSRPMANTTTMSDSASAPKRGKGFLQTQLTGGVIPFCGYCSQPIRGQYILALNKTWCPNHFVCSNSLCKRSLEEQGFVEEQGRLYCENCYETHFAPGCAKCHQRIKGDCLNALDKQWHPECFTCTHCRKPFGNSSFYLEDNLPYCEKDWNNLFTTKCVGCGYPIAAGDRWVEALNQNYHSTCFRCTVCGSNLEGQSFFAKGGRPFCKAHAR